MVNHFASLLGNIDLATLTPLSVAAVLGDTAPDPDVELSEDGTIPIAMGDIYTALRYAKLESPLIWKDYAPIVLPAELLNFYNLIFPKFTSNYYKHFLLYSYLRIIASTPLAKDVLKYDSRLTYNLEEMQDYFRFYRTSDPVSSDSNFKLYLSGKLKSDETLDYYLNNFVIRQVHNTSSVFIFSTTQGKYYKPGQVATAHAENMSIPLVLNPAKTESIPINIGNTGLSFFIVGPFEEPTIGFTAKENRLWSFTAEAPFLFDFNNILSQLESREAIVSSMLSYNRESFDYNYESIWNTHYNSIHRFAGLLMAYVTRVNSIWQQYAEPTSQ